MVIFFTLHHSFEFCRLLLDFILPTSNILPRTYREIYVIMKEFGMEYQDIDACPNDHIIVYAQYALENECPQCQTSRYRTDKVKKGASQSSLLYSYNSTSPAVV